MLLVQSLLLLIFVYCNCIKPREGDASFGFWSIREGGWVDWCEGQRSEMLVVGIITMNRSRECAVVGVREACQLSACVDTSCTHISHTQGRYVHLFFVSVILMRGLWWVLFHRSCCVIAVHLFTTLQCRSCAEPIFSLPPVYCWIATDVQGVVPHQSCHISGVGDVARCTTLIVSRLRHDATRRGTGEPKASRQWQWVLKCWHGQLAWVLLANSTARRSGSAH